MSCQLDNWEDDQDLCQVAIDNGQEYHCDSCGKDLTCKVRVRCMECDNYDACVTCFAQGREINKHKKTHSYRILRALDFSIFESKWTASEELSLLDGIQVFGLGNWEQVSNHVGTKTTEECSSHWVRVYHDSEFWPYPDINKDVFPSSPSRQTNNNTQSKNTKHSPAQLLTSCPETHRVQGYMPTRKEFCIEYENDAELYIKDLEFVKTDTPLDTELKFAMLSIYNSVLDKREERLKHILKYDLLELKYKSREEKEAHQTYGVFCRMQSPQDFNKFINGVVNEVSLRERIKELQDYISIGLHTLADVEMYKREKYSKLKYSRPQQQQRVTHKYSKKTYPPMKNSPSSNNSVFDNISSLPVTVPPMPLFSTSNPTSPVMTNTKYSPLHDANDEDNVIEQKLNNCELDKSQLLSPSELQLCNKLSIYPKAYLAIKETILSEYALRGNLRKSQAKRLLKIDVNKTSRIYNFFVEMGWIKHVSRNPKDTAYSPSIHRKNKYLYNTH